MVFLIIQSKNKIEISRFEISEINVITCNIPPGVEEIESLNEEFKWTIIDKECITEEDFPFTIKPNYSTLHSITGIRPARGLQLSFVPDRTWRKLLAFKAKVIHDEWNL